MPRKLRLEYPGAIYHVINRGNYRTCIFETEGAQAAFESCVFEACEKSNWRLHAFVIMGNHYHLALETPEGNLVAGMQWLQATFANRFNKVRRERGHLFQGRYKALLVDGGGYLGPLCHYIHLNPVRAGMVTVEQLGGYRPSSYWYLKHPDKRPRFLCSETALREAGGLLDTPDGWDSYEHYLAWQSANGPAGRNAAYESMSKGWALGSKGFKAGLIQDHQVAAEARAWDQSGAKEIREQRWDACLAEELNKRGKTLDEAQRELKSAPWKVAIAWELKKHTQATNAWITGRLNMGTPVAVSQYVSLLRKQG